MHWLLLFLVTSSAFGESSLVRTFCSEMIFRMHQGIQIEQSDVSWRDFVSHLEKPETRREISDSALQQCLLDNHEDLEKGDFLLQGSRVLTRLSRQQNEMPRKESQGEPVLGSATLPGFGEIRLPSVPRRADTVGDERVAQRSEYYASLWSAFLEHLRKTMTVRKETLRMKLSGS